MAQPPHQSRLWQAQAHPVLFRKGMSLEASGLAGSAITYWQTMLITSTRLLGNAHANAVAARDRLGRRRASRPGAPATPLRCSPTRWPTGST